MRGGNVAFASNSATHRLHVHCHVCVRRHFFSAEFEEADKAYTELDEKIRHVTSQSDPVQVSDT